jgi:hypothetical protein
MLEEPNEPLCQSDPAAISYALLRHLGFMLDELSAQGQQYGRMRVVSGAGRGRRRRCEPNAGFGRSVRQ